MHPVPRLVSVHGVYGNKHSALCVLELQTEYMLTAVLAVRRAKSRSGIRCKQMGCANKDKNMLRMFRREDMLPVSQQRGFL